MGKIVGANGCTRPPFPELAPGVSLSIGKIETPLRHDESSSLAKDAQTSNAVDRTPSMEARCVTPLAVIEPEAPAVMPGLSSFSCGSVAVHGTDRQVDLEWRSRKSRAHSSITQKELMPNKWLRAQCQALAAVNANPLSFPSSLSSTSPGIPTMHMDTTPTSSSISGECTTSYLSMPSAAAPPQVLKVRGDGRCLFRAVHRAVIGCTGEKRYSDGQHESEAEEVQEKEHAGVIRALMVVEDGRTKRPPCCTARR